MTQNALIQACYYPAFTAAESLALYKAQAAWHFAPLGEMIEIIFPETPAEAKAAAKSSDVIFFWQKEAYWGAIAQMRRKGLVVDEFSEQAVGDRLDAFVANNLKLGITANQSKFLKTVQRKKPTAKSALIIGSGPDISDFKTSEPHSFDNSINIYLSTAIFDRSLMEACPPDVIIAADGPSQFALSQTASDYRLQAISALRRYSCVLLIPAQYWPSTQAHWPEDVREQIYAVPQTPHVTRGHSFADNWHYEPTSNVLTSFGLPCAASFVKNIRLAGISLSPRNGPINANTQHWEHNDESHYQRHIAPMLAAHPASGQSDGRYLERHHDRLSQELLAYGAKGVSFSNLKYEKIIFSDLETALKTSRQSPLKIKLFNLIAKAEHHPWLITGAAFISAGLLGGAVEYSIGLAMLGFFIAGGFAAFFVAAILFLRLRQNRMSARLESKLSQQQAQQFANLSERLDALEREQ